MVGGQLAHLEAAEGGGLVGGARHLLDACLAQARIALARHALDHPREGGALEALEEARRRSVGAFAEEVLVDVRLLLAVLLRELLERHVERGAPGVLHAARDRDVRRLVEELLDECHDLRGAAAEPRVITIRLDQHTLYLRRGLQAESTRSVK